MEQTTLCYIEKDGCWLMMHRVKKQNDVNRDKWIGIGGHFEEGETPEECMSREVYEETGLVVTEYKYHGIITFVSDEFPSEQMHLFRCTEWIGELNRYCDEGDLEWVNIEKVMLLPMWEGDKIFLSLMKDETDFFSLKLQYQGNKLIQAKLNGKNIEKR